MHCFVSITKVSAYFVFCVKILILLVSAGPTKLTLLTNKSRSGRADPESAIIRVTVMFIFIFTSRVCAPSHTDPCDGQSLMLTNGLMVFNSLRANEYRRV